MVAQRGTSNSNLRGNTEDRRRRRQWLVENWPADWEWYEHPEKEGRVVVQVGTPQAAQLREWGWVARPLCRCYRCGTLLDEDSVSPDRIKPGCEGGTYRRENIRPCCSRCNSQTGGALGAARKSSKSAAL